MNWINYEFYVVSPCQLLSATLNEDGYELSLTVNFALRGANDDSSIGRKSTYDGGSTNQELLSSYTRARSGSIASYGSMDSLRKQLRIYGIYVLKTLCSFELNFIYANTWWWWWLLKV